MRSAPSSTRTAAANWARHFADREQGLGIWAGLFHLADRLNLDYDLVPSLHVALSVACITAFCIHTRVIGRTLLWIWAAAIALSTLLTHQHHVIDVVTGWFLATLCMRVIYFRLVGLGDWVPVR